MRLLIGSDALVADWVARQIPCMAPKVARAEFGQAFGPSTAIGVMSDDATKLLGGVVFHGYDPDWRSVELSVAASTVRWLTRPVINAIMAYPFDQLGCARVTGATPKRARAARKFLDQFGFKREGVLAKGFGDDDAIISRLLKREWQASPFYLANPPPVAVCAQA